MYQGEITLSGKSPSGTSEQLGAADNVEVDVAVSVSGGTVSLLVVVVGGSSLEVGGTTLGELVLIKGLYVLLGSIVEEISGVSVDRG